MSLSPSCATIASLLVLGGVTHPQRLVAQDVTYFRALATPPRSVGTCIPATPRNGDAASVLTKYHLVMSSRTPNRRREIRVMVDTAGRTMGYGETGFTSTGLLSGDGDNVVASISPSGRVQGWRLRSKLALSDSTRLPLDTARLRAMSENASTQASREPLDVEAQHRVLEMVTWLRKRCPR